MFVFCVQHCLKFFRYLSVNPHSSEIHEKNRFSIAKLLQYSPDRLLLPMHVQSMTWSNLPNRYCLTAQRKIVGCSTPMSCASWPSNISRVEYRADANFGRCLRSSYGSGRTLTSSLTVSKIPSRCGWSLRARLRKVCNARSTSGLPCVP